MNAKIKLLCVHGLGDHRDLPWKEEWKEAIMSSFPMQDSIELDINFLTYDDIFENMEFDKGETIRALGKLMRSGISTIFARPRSRGFFDMMNKYLKWHAGYVVKWVEDDEFQFKTRSRVLDSIIELKPDVLLGHSLGSLITYNTLTHPDAEADDIKRIIKKMTYISLGSQIGNPFIVQNLTPGRIEPLNVKQWYHLYNEEDNVFTAPITIWDADNFQQVDAYFDIRGFADHAATSYLSNDETIHQVWKPIAIQATIPESKIKAVPATRISMPGITRLTGKEKRKPRNRALLVGINDYPNPQDRLDGCVNDTFLISSVLQECIFKASDIRLCLDSRATAEGILERLQWLLDDPQEGDCLFFYYSGHGAQLPTYGQGDIIDRMDETLVPYDFDWSPKTCITDDQIFNIYSLLPYGTNLIMIFDCCHSGGIHRAGNNKIRGINPPDDIRHRAIQWDSGEDMWKERDFNELNKSFSTSKKVNQQFFGANGITTRLGRGSTFRKMSANTYKKLKDSRKGKSIGPFLPVIIEACQESQYSYEYRHGVVSYGAFTYSLVKTLRKNKTITFNNLVDETRSTLEHLNYDQMPQILGPTKIRKQEVPWMKKS